MLGAVTHYALYFPAVQHRYSSCHCRVNNSGCCTQQLPLSSVPLRFHERPDIKQPLNLLHHYAKSECCRSHGMWMQQHQGELVSKEPLLSNRMVKQGWVTNAKRNNAPSNFAVHVTLWTLDAQLVCKDESPSLDEASMRLSALLLKKKNHKLYILYPLPVHVFALISLHINNGKRSPGCP